MYKKYTFLNATEQNILGIFTDLEAHYFAEISKKTAMARPSIIRVLRKLAENGILKVKTTANVKYYTLNRTAPAYTLISLAEYAKTAAFLDRNPSIKRAIDIFRSEFTDYIIMLVFGSHAKGQANKKSDIDVLLAKEDFSREDIERAEKMAELANGRTGLKISPYMMKLSELAQKKEFTEEIAENHILIDGSEIFFRLVTSWKN